MSKFNEKIPLLRARQLADCLVADLECACEQIEIAGSIRRKRPEVGDIEIVAVPKMAIDLLGQESLSLLEGRLHILALNGILKSNGANGAKYKRLLLIEAPIQVDLFITTPAQWGLILMIRTGPAEFSKRLVTPRKHGGLLPSYLRVKDGWIWNGEKRLETPTEEAVWEILGLASVPPEARR